MQAFFSTRCTMQHVCVSFLPYCSYFPLVTASVFFLSPGCAKCTFILFFFFSLPFSFGCLPRLIAIRARFRKDFLFYVKLQSFSYGDFHVYIFFFFFVLFVTPAWSSVRYQLSRGHQFSLVYQVSKKRKKKKAPQALTYNEIFIDWTANLYSTFLVISLIQQNDEDDHDDATGFVKFL